MISRIASVVFAALCLATTAFATQPGMAGVPWEASFRVVILGSSTAAGFGANPGSMSWPNRYATYLSHLSPGDHVVNRAVGGYTTYQCMPTGSVPPANRPAPDPAANITFAISQHPSAIILNLPSNDAALSYSLEETEANFRAIAAAARAAGIPLWVTTPQPRNFSEEKRAAQKAVVGFINVTFGARSLDFWTDLAAPGGTLLHAYDSGDGVHLNNVGHAMLFRRVAAADIPEAVCASTARTRAERLSAPKPASPPAAPVALR